MIVTCVNIIDDFAAWTNRTTDYFAQQTGLLLGVPKTNLTDIAVSQGKPAPPDNKPTTVVCFRAWGVPLWLALEKLNAADRETYGWTVVAAYRQGDDPNTKFPTFGLSAYDFPLLFVSLIGSFGLFGPARGAVVGIILGMIALTALVVVGLVYGRDRYRRMRGVADTSVRIRFHQIYSAKAFFILRSTRSRSTTTPCRCPWRTCRLRTLPTSKRPRSRPPAPGTSRRAREREKKTTRRPGARGLVLYFCFLSADHSCVARAFFQQARRKAFLLPLSSVGKEALEQSRIGCREGLKGHGDAPCFAHQTSDLDRIPFVSPLLKELSYNAPQFRAVPLLRERRHGSPCRPERRPRRRRHRAHPSDRVSEPKSDRLFPAGWRRSMAWKARTTAILVTAALLVATANAVLPRGAKPTCTFIVCHEIALP